MSWRTRTAIALGVFAAVGSLAASLDHEMNNGAATVNALRAIRAGDLAATTGLLEGSAADSEHEQSARR